MSTAGVEVKGSVKPDGTLELDERLQLPAGRVRVTVQPVAETAPPAENWFEYLMRVRAEREAAGVHFRTAEEIEAEREDFRSGDERIEELFKEAERQPGRQE